MNLLKLTLLFCLFTTILCGQQEVPGYVVLPEGDTLRGRIVITYSKIKFRHEGGKTKYLRSELADYGYYGNKVFFSKPDVITPAPESDIISTIMLTEGDTLPNFYLQNVNPDFIIGYFEYPKYILYEARDGKLDEIVIHDKEDGNIRMSLTTVNDYPKRGNILPIYVKSVINSGLKAYNVDNARPYYIDYKSNRILGSLAANALPLGIFTVVVAKKITESVNNINERQHSRDWIIHKNDRTYEINSALEWEKAFGAIFHDDKGFVPYLKERKISRSRIQYVLEAYGDFCEAKKNN